MTLSLSGTLEKGISYLQVNELEQAEKLFQAVLHLQEDNIDGLHLLGILKLRQGQTKTGLALFEKAVVCCQQKLEQESDNSQLCLLKAYIYIDLQQWNNAESAFRQALNINPDLSDAYNGMGSIYYGQGQVQRAYSMFYQALKKDNKNVEALYNQGIVLRSLGELAEAEQMLGRAVILSPQHVQAHASLGLTLQELGRLEEAKSSYETVLKLAPENGFASHMLSALKGQTPSKAPDEFVSELFDAYAPSYEQHLQDTLEFKAPDLIVQALDEHLSEGLPFSQVLDIGCGTGLMAEKLKDRVKQIDGVDLSRKMLLIASAKDLYRSLEVSDVDDFLKISNKLYDCCIASDVFIYSGDLEETFFNVYKCLKNGGQFVFTTENTEMKRYVLLNSGRYAHSVSYIEALAEKSGFEIGLQKAVLLRKEEGRWLDGFVYILTKNVS